MKLTLKVFSTVLGVMVASSAWSQTKMDVEKLEKKYWEQNRPQDVGVVQNRLYSKSQKLIVGIMGGYHVSDPFLTITSQTLQTTYHFDETWGVNLRGTMFNTAGSQALKTLRDGGKDANTVDPKWAASAGLDASLLYGKLSLLGSSIVYYDMHFLSTLGMVKTENNSSPSGELGLGQRFFMTKNMALRTDYRFLVYRETIVEKVITAKLKETVGTRMNYTHSVMAGVEWMF